MSYIAYVIKKNRETIYQDKKYEKERTKQEYYTKKENYEKIDEKIAIKKMRIKEDLRRRRESKLKISQDDFKKQF